MIDAAIEETENGVETGDALDLQAIVAQDHLVAMVR